MDCLNTIYKLLSDGGIITDGVEYIKLGDKSIMRWSGTEWVKRLDVRFIPPKWSKVDEIPSEQHGINCVTCNKKFQIELMEYKREDSNNGICLKCGSLLSSVTKFYKKVR